MSLKEYDLKKIGIFIGLIFVILLAVIGSVSSIYFYNKYQAAQKKLRQTSISSQEDVQALVDKVGKLIKLPEGEMPTVATVSDLDPLKNQAFFAKAKIGDKVLLYTQAKRAILYDPIENVVLEVGPLVLPSISPPITASQQFPLESSTISAQITIPVTQVKERPKVAIFNGTSQTGLSNSFASELYKKLPEIEIVQKENASKETYAQTIIVDLSGRFIDRIEEIAKAAGAIQSALPSDEKSPPDIDILIILGNDKK